MFIQVSKKIIQKKPIKTAFKFWTAQIQFFVKNLSQMRNRKC